MTPHAQSMQALLTKKPREANSNLARHGHSGPSMTAGYALRRSLGIPLYLQPKLAISQPDDSFEQEADRVAEQVMCMPDSAANRSSVDFTPIHVLSRQHESNSSNIETSSFGLDRVDAILHQGGQPLDGDTRRFFESRFGADFGDVRIHTDAEAAESARSVNAKAYTVGSKVVFNTGQYTPHNDSGRRLLAHELAHVVQQSWMSSTHPGRGRGTHAFASTTVRRFSDTDHHVIEEAALRKVFTEDQLKAIEKGNMQRDYSQAPAAVNALLLGQKTRFGGYAQHEHFDNFVFDRANDRWVSQDEFDKIWDDHADKWIKRSVPATPKAGNPRITPPQYIGNQLLAAVQKDVPDAGAFEHLGNAFHTIEDFFAHSNFIELTLGDLSHGDELATHSTHAKGPGSEGSILGSVSDPTSAAFFNNRFREQQATASPLSHGLLAKDFHGNRNHEIAITLAALVIRQIGMMVKEAFALETRTQREAFVRRHIIATLSRYFRPPTDKDKWWEELQSEDRGVMRRTIRQLQNETPVTVNQSPGSPLRNIEATRFSTMKAIGMGTSLSIPLGDRKFLTVGHMLYLPGTGGTPVDTGLILPPYVSDRDEKVRLVSGFQFTGSFDETTWFK